MKLITTIHKFIINIIIRIYNTITIYILKIVLITNH
jgi:hypothetical protein